MVMMFMYKQWQAIRFSSGEQTETGNMHLASPSHKNAFIVVYPGAVCTAEPVEKYLPEPWLFTTQAEVKLFLLLLFLEI